MEPILPDTYSKEEKEEIERRHKRLIDAWQTRKEAQDLEMVDKAFYFAVEAHKNQRRRSGEPYIYHPIEVATIAAHDIGLGRTSIICALLHDVVEDTQYTLDNIKEMFGEKVSRVVDGLTKFDKISKAPKACRPRTSKRSSPRCRTTSAWYSLSSVTVSTICAPWIRCPSTNS